MKTLLLTIFIANALFWGLFPHNAHCLFLENINKVMKTNIECPPHHILSWPFQQSSPALVFLPLLEV